MNLAVDDHLPPGRIINFRGPGFYPPDYFVLDQIYIASTQTWGALAAENVVDAYLPEGLPVR